MATYHVTPDADNDTQRYGWKVTKEGRGRQSNHTKKSAAKRKAKQLAGANDTVVIHRLDGTIQNSISG